VLPGLTPMAAAPQEGHAASSRKEFCTEAGKVDLGFFSGVVWISLELLRLRHIETMRGVIPSTQSALRSARPALAC